MNRLIPFSALLALLAACGGSESTTDAGRTSPDASARDSGTAPDAGNTADAAIAPDAGPTDSGVVDAGTPDAGPSDAGAPDAGSSDTGVVDAGGGLFTLVSGAFMEGGVIPRRHSCRGDDLQPGLTWSNPPGGTMSFAIVFIDETIDFTHWVAYDIPAAFMSLPPGASDVGMLPAGTREADAYCTQFCGPCPPNQHTYTFQIYALDVATIPFSPRGAFGQRQIDAAFAGHVLGRATLTATFTP